MFENPQKKSRNAIFQGDFQALCIPSFFTFFQSVFVRLINKGRQRIEGGKFTDVEKNFEGYICGKRGEEEEAFFLSPATIQVIGNAELLGLEIGQVF